MSAFERRILKELCRSIKNEQGEFKMRTNEKLRSSLYGVILIIGVIRNSLMRWFGHAWDIRGGTGEQNKMDTGDKKHRDDGRENKGRY